LIPVLYTPGVTLTAAQFIFAGIPRAIPGNNAASGPPWTFNWTPAILAAYSMPVGAIGGGPAFPAGFAQPNQLRDGEYPQIIGNAVLSDLNGMGPYGGPLDCSGIGGLPGAAYGILNIEIAPTGVCAGGTSWSPPSATLVAGANQILDPLRSGERIDNVPPALVAYVLNSRPGLPDWPQIPTTGAAGDVGAPVIPAGTWINENVNFAGAGIYAGPGADAGVSRAFAPFPAPTFLPSIFQANTNGGAFATLSPATSAGLPETVTNTVYRIQVIEADELNNQRTTPLTGAAGGTAQLGVDGTDPFLQHTALISNPDRDAFDLTTLGAGSGAAGDDLDSSAGPNYNYFLNWTDPVNVGASGFTAFGGNPVWRQLHRVTPAGTAAVFGTGTGVVPLWTPGVLNYNRLGASQQPVACLITVCAGPIANGYYVFRAYVLDDAGNASRDALAANPTLVGTVTWESAAIRRQAVVDGPAAAGQPTVFGITSPVNMVGGSTVTFTSNSSDNLDLGQSFLSIDYVAFQSAPYWAANSTAAAPNALGGYFTPVAMLAPTQGTTGGVRHNGAESEHGVIFNSPFETAATIVSTAALTRNVTGFIRSVEFVCGPAGPAFCGAAPLNWASIALNLHDSPPAGAPTVPAGWFAPPSAGANTAYAAGRPMLASFSQFDATRFDHVQNATTGNINYVLEQDGPTSVLSPYPHRSVSTAAINPVSVLLNGTGGTFSPVGTEVSPYHFELNGGSAVAATVAHSVAWAIQTATAAIAAPTVTARPNPPAAVNAGGRTLTVSITARLVSASSSVTAPPFAAAAMGGAAGTLPGPGQNIFAGPLGRVDFFVLEPATGTLRYLGSQSNPVLFENHPSCVGGGAAVQSLYRCWDFSGSFTVDNFVSHDAAIEPVQVLAIGVNAVGDGLATFPVDAL